MISEIVLQDQSQCITIFSINIHASTVQEIYQLHHLLFLLERFNNHNVKLCMMLRSVLLVSFAAIFSLVTQYSLAMLVLRDKTITAAGKGDYTVSSHVF